MAKHKCKIPDPPPDTGRWMGTYGDMVTLLMAFFVMLFAVSETNNQKFQAFVAGLAGPFDNPAIELGLVDGATVEETATTPIQLIAPAAEVQRDANRDAGGDELLEQARLAGDQLDQIEEELQEVLDQTTVPISVDIRDDERGLVVSISTDEVLFPVGSAEIAQEGVVLIGEIAPILVDAPNTVVIEGHTDNQPLNAGGYTNWNLSTDRAVAVLTLLGNEHGLPYNRISASGYGEYRPLVDNTDDDSRSVNRRVEILIVGLNISSGGAAPPPAAPADPGLDAEAEDEAEDVVMAEDDRFITPAANIAAPTLGAILGQNE